MLVLTRKMQQQIRIGDSITITILRVKGNAVRVGVEAPRQVRVVRAELNRADIPAEDQASEPISDPSPAPLKRHTSRRTNNPSSEPSSGRHDDVAPRRFDAPPMPDEPLPPGDRRSGQLPQEDACSLRQSTAGALLMRRRRDWQSRRMALIAQMG